MKKFYLVLLVMCFAMSLPANARLSCDELDELSIILDDLASELEGVDSVGVNGEIDLALGDLTSALNRVADVEKDKRLSAWIQDLEIAWEDREADDFHPPFFMCNL